MTKSCRRARGVLMAPVALAVALSACSGSAGHRAAPAPQSTVVLTIPPTTAPTTPPAAQSTTSTTAPQTSGPRTVLSPIGLNVRAQPVKTAAVLGTAARGTVLTVLAHSVGWFQVKGATVTGWMNDSPTLSAQGKFAAYMDSAGAFGALYPATWNAAVSPPASVVFRAPTGGETIVVTTAASLGLLAAGRAGYRASGSEQAVVCGVTTYLTRYVKASAPSSTAPPPPAGAGAEANLAQIRITLDPQHALGIDANLTDLSQLQTVRDFVNSVTFPYPQCQH